jgi:hypothetical protein
MERKMSEPDQPFKPPFGIPPFSSWRAKREFHGTLEDDRLEYVMEMIPAMSKKYPKTELSWPIKRKDK